MRNLTILLALIFTVTFSSPSFAEWTKVRKNVNGDIYYVDFERIRKHDGFVYWWDLFDYIAPKEKYMSAKFYSQGDCKMFRSRTLQILAYKESMGKGAAYSHSKPTEWVYPNPNSADETTLKLVCAYAK
jgi:hypothetical protein